LLFYGELGPLKKLPRLLCSGDLCLLRLTEKLMGPVEVTNFDLRLGFLDKTARQWVLRVERGKLRLEPLVLIGDLSQLLR
jgi:hypothetical protein